MFPLSKDYGGEVLELTPLIFLNFDIMKSPKDLSLNKMFKGNSALLTFITLGFDRKYVFLSMQNHSKSQKFRNNHDLIGAQICIGGARSAPEELTFSSSR